jgi:ubiquinol-cytochrome c reductase cytochrome b subunit
MRSLCSWFLDRTGIDAWLRRLADSPVEGRACWCKVLPATILFAFCVQAVTGFFLWAYYSPSEQTAWESVHYLQQEVVGGWLLRAIHHYSAHVLLAMLIAIVLQSILRGTYRAPRELVFWATIGLGFFALAAVLTGDLLNWDQNAYAATKTRTGFLALLPWVGQSFLKIAIGGPGPTLGHLTLTRFLAMHVGLFAGGFAVLLFLRATLARRAAMQAGSDGSIPYWPAQAWRSGMACLGVMAVVLALALQHGTTLPDAGAPLLSPADPDPANAYAAARPEWFLVGVYEFSHLFPGQWQIVPIFIAPKILGLLLLAMPFVARWRVGQTVNLVVTFVVLLGLVGLSWWSLAKDRDDPRHRQALAVERWQADRVSELVRLKGIPPAGAIALMRDDPKLEGRRLFLQQCATCHNHFTGDNNAAIGDDITTESPTAPNLARYASRAWLAGLLNPKHINGPDYFGNTKSRGGRMAGFVRDVLAEFDADEIEKVVAALSAEARLSAQSELDAKNTKIIAEGRKLIADDVGCVNCHRFHDKGKLGSAPDLTGYGSPEWLAAIIRNAASPRFYGSRNDRMPPYAASSAMGISTLSPHEIELLVEWLRGEWPEVQSP